MILNYGTSRIKLFGVDLRKSTAHIKTLDRVAIATLRGKEITSNLDDGTLKL